MPYAGTEAQLKAAIASLRSQGKTESTSKKLGKLTQQLASGDYGTSSFGGTGTGFGGAGIMSGVQDFFARQKAESEGLIDEARKKFNLPELEAGQLAATNTLLGLQGQYEALPEQIKGETRGFDVGAKELARIQESRQTPLLNQVSTATRGLQAASTALGIGQQGFQSTVDFISDRLAREASGFTVGLQGELDVLLQKMANQQALDVAEYNRATQLALAENNYEKEKSLITYRTNESIRETLSTREPKTDIYATLSAITGGQLGGGTTSTRTSTTTTPSYTYTPMQPLKENSFLGNVGNFLQNLFDKF